MDRGVAATNHRGVLDGLRKAKPILRIQAEMAT